MDEPTWMIEPAEFSDAWRALERGDAFELDISETIVLYGFDPDEIDREQDAFFGLLPSSMAYKTLKVAYDYDAIEYVVFVNDCLIGFKSPMGWSFLPENSYSAGDVPRGWKHTRSRGYQIFTQLLNSNNDED